MKRLFLFSLLFLGAFLYSEPKTIELVSNHPTHIDHVAQIFQQKNADIRVVASNLRHYGIGLKKQSKWDKFLHRWSLDFWRSISVDEHTEKIVFFNLNNHFARDFKLNYLPREKLILFMWEPPVILPNMYKKKSLLPFSKIYTWDDDLVDGKQFFKFYYPVLQPMLDELPAFEQKKFCTFVGTNYKGSSRGCLYEERKKAIAFFEEVEEKGFEFYGRKWDPSQYKSYKGSVDDKIATIKQYRFSLCYENSRDKNGYVTEKIFDCFAAGSIPIYWGAPNITSYVPKDCFIDRRDFATLDDLYAFLKRMSKQEYEGYLQRIRAYLKSEQAQFFSSEHFAQIVFEATCGSEDKIRAQS